MSELRILIVDDAQTWQELLPRVLERLPRLTHTDAVKTVQRARTLIDAKTYHLVVVDLSLLGGAPDDVDTEGLEFIKAVRDSRLNYNCGIILMTAYGTTDIVRKAFVEAGIDDFFDKGEFGEREDEFLAICRRVIQERLLARRQDVGIWEDSVKTVARVFLSYAREDAEKVASLYRDLSDAGFKPWMDKKDILPGEKWKSSIQRAIHHSDFFLACLSANSVNKRGFLQKEIRTALDLWHEMLDSDIYLIPVRLEDCEVPEKLRDFQWVDLFDENGWTQLVKAIQVGIRRRQMSSSC